MRPTFSPLDGHQAASRRPRRGDQLRRQQFRTLIDDTWPHSVEAAVDTALLGRYYERICDHAVEIGERVIYIETGHEPD